MKVVAVQVYVHEFSWFLGWWFLNIPLNHARCHFCGNERTHQGKKIWTIYPLTSIDCNWNAWRIIPVSTCQWLITMVSKPPFIRVVPLPNFLSEMILQVHPTRYRHRPKTMEEQARGWGESANWDMLGGQVKFCLVEMLHHVLKRKLIPNILQDIIGKIGVFFSLAGCLSVFKPRLGLTCFEWNIRNTYNNIIYVGFCLNTMTVDSAASKKGSLHKYE